MKLRIHKWPNGKEGYSFGVTPHRPGMKPDKIEEVEVTKEELDEILKSPKKFREKRKKDAKSN